MELRAGRVVWLPEKILGPFHKCQAAASGLTGKLNQLIRAHIPQAHGLVAPAGGQPMSIGAESQSPDGAGMTEQEDGLGRWIGFSQVPQAHAGICTAGGEPVIIRAETESGY